MNMNPMINRRSVLAGLGAATAASAVGVASAAPASEENPALLDAWGAFNVALAGFDNAMAAKVRAIDAFDAMAPVCPDVLKCNNSTTLADGTKARGYIADRLQDGDGKDIHHHRTGYVYVVDSYQLTKLLVWQDHRLAATKRLKRLLPVAVEFEAGRAAAHLSAGLDAAKTAFWRADSQLRVAVQDVADADARTTQGLAIKAKAITTAIGRDSEYSWTYSTNIKRFSEQVEAVLGGLINV